MAKVTEKKNNSCDYIMWPKIPSWHILPQALKKFPWFGKANGKDSWGPLGAKSDL